MKIIIDERERDLYEKCESIASSNPMLYSRISKEVLPLGDIYIKTDEEKDVMLIERKSLSDLLASIKDGRYEEQSYRLTHSSGFPAHSIVYIIEGSLSQLRTTIEKKIVYSAITSLNYFKGFSVIRTMNVQETAEYIIWMSEKIEKNFLKGVFPYYLQPVHKSVSVSAKLVIETNTITENNSIIENVLETGENKSNITLEENNISNESTPSTTSTEFSHSPTISLQNAPANYCTVVKKVKKDNITPENIGEIILCQIPGISSVTAISIMKKFTTFPNFIKELENNPNCLDDIVCETKGKTRKIGKNCIENIHKFLRSVTDNL